MKKKSLDDSDSDKETMDLLDENQSSSQGSSEPTGAVHIKFKCNFNGTYF